MEFESRKKKEWKAKRTPSIKLSINRVSESMTQSKEYVTEYEKWLIRSRRKAQEVIEKEKRVEEQLALKHNEFQKELKKRQQQNQLRKEDWEENYKRIKRIEV